MNVVDEISKCNSWIEARKVKNETFKWIRGKKNLKPRKKIGSRKKNFFKKINSWETEAKVFFSFRFKNFLLFQFSKKLTFCDFERNKRFSNQEKWKMNGSLSSLLKFRLITRKYPIYSWVAPAKIGWQQLKLLVIIWIVFYCSWLGDSSPLAAWG